MKQRLNSLLEKSNHWVTILWSLPEVINVLMSIKAQMDGLSDTSYQAVTNNLKKIKKKTYFEVLSLCQNMEMTLCLKKGTISKESQPVLDELFHAFLDKLEIRKVDRFYLKLNVQYLHQLKDNMDTIIQSDEAKEKEIEKKLQPLKEIQRNLLLIKSRKSLLPFMAQKNISIEVQTIIDNFQTIKPLLKFKLGLYSLNDDGLKKSLNSNGSESSELGEACEKLVRILYSKKATISLTKKFGHNQLHYIQNLKQEKTKHSEKEIQEFVNDSFDDLISDILKSSEDWSMTLRHLKVDYQTMLLEYIDKYKNIVVGAAIKKASKIEDTLQSQILSLKEKFDASNSKAYLVLDSVFASIISDFNFNISISTPQKPKARPL